MAVQAKVISINVQAGSPDRTAQHGKEPKRILVGHSLGAACAAAEIIDHPEARFRFPPRKMDKHHVALWHDARNPILPKRLAESMALLCPSRACVVTVDRGTQWQGQRQELGEHVVACAGD